MSITNLMAENIFKNVPNLSEISLFSFFIKLCLTAVLMLVITQIYKYTHRSISYTHTFLHTLIVVGITTCAILIVIGHSVPMAFGLLGALSIIRFRTAIKDSRDTGYLFFVIAVSMSIANSLYLVSLILTFFVGTVLVLMYQLNYGMQVTTQKILKVQLPQNKKIEDLALPLKKYFSQWELLESSWNQTQASHDCAFLVTSRSGKFSEQEVIRELKEINGDRPIYLYGSSQAPIF